MASGGDIERQPLTTRDNETETEKTTEEEKNDTGEKQRICCTAISCLMVFLYYVPLKVKPNIGLLCSWIHCVWFIVTVVKLVFLIIYTTDTAQERSHFGTFVTNGHITLQHLLLSGWNSGDETLPYPPAQGAFAVYNVEDLEESINYAVAQYYKADELATGYFKRIDNDGIDVHIKYFNMSFDTQTNISSNLSVKNVSFVPKYGFSNSSQDGRLVYNITEDLVANNISFALQSVLSVELNMSIHSVRVDESSEEASCLCVYIKVSFIDRNHDGQVNVFLKTTTTLIKCQTMKYDIKEKNHTANPCPAKVFLIISICINGVGLLAWLFIFKKMWKDVKTKNSHQPTSEEPAGNPLKKICCKLPQKLKKIWQIGWNILPGFLETTVFFLGDCLPLCAIHQISRKKQDGETLKDLDVAMVILAFGVFFSVCTTLRFLKVNTKFSILIKTMKKAFGPVVCFFFWIAVLFGAFLLFGYVVFGPYHIKFNTVSKSLLTLFSIINGDEIYATVSITQDEYAGHPKEIRDLINIFVYVYVSLFTILVFNLFVAIFLTAYEEVKRDTEDGVQISNLKGFLKQNRGEKLVQTLIKLQSGISETYENLRVLRLLKKMLVILKKEFASTNFEKFLCNLEGLLPGQNQLTHTKDFPKLKEFLMLAIAEETSVEELLTDLLTDLQTQEASAAENRIVSSQSHPSQTNATEKTKLKNDSKKGYGTATQQSTPETSITEKEDQEDSDKKNQMLQDVLKAVKGKKEGQMTIKQLFEKLEKSLSKRMIEEVHGEDLCIKCCPLLIRC